MLVFEYSNQIFEGSAESFHWIVYAMAQASKAIFPQDAGGPFGQRIGTSVKGDKSWGLRTSAFVTHRSSQSDWARYSLVVLNCASRTLLQFTLVKKSHDDLGYNTGSDGGTAGWNPMPVKSTISFRGMQVRSSNCLPESTVSTDSDTLAI